MVNRVRYHGIRREGRPSDLRGTRLRFGVVLRWTVLLAVLCLPTSAVSRVLAHPARLTAHIFPDVWAATESPGAVEVLVVLDAQIEAAHLLRSLGTIEPEARGAYVRDLLWQTAQASQASLRSWLEAQGVTYRAFYIVNALLIEADRSLVTALARRPEVTQILTNPQVALPPEPVVAPPNMHYSAAMAPEPNLALIQAPEVRALGYRGEGVVIAGQDTGYDWTHPALQEQYRGWDGVTANHDYNWHDAIHSGDTACGVDVAYPCDDSSHGTHTMGTMVGDGGQDHQIGVAPGAEWIGCRNMASGVGTPATYMECFEFFLAPYPVDGDPSMGDPAKAPDVINNSWSCPTYEGCDAVHIEVMEEVIARVRAAGILVVTSAGNDGATCGSVDEPPAMYDAATTVGATDMSDTIAAFSSRGTDSDLTKPDLVAPGIGIASSVPGDTYGFKSGTSMAAPHVAGVAALIWSARPDLRGQVAATEQLLTSTAARLTSNACGDASDAIPNNVYGWGRVDALAAVKNALLPYRQHLMIISR